MDEFGVLVESIGFKSQVKSAPMADLRGKNRNLGINSSRNMSKPPYNSNSVNGSFDNQIDGIFPSNSNPKTQSNGYSNGYDDVFGGPTLDSKPSEMFDLDSVFMGSSNFGSKSMASDLYDNGDDIFGGMPGLKSSVSEANSDDVFGSRAWQPKQSDSIDELLRNFAGMGSESNGLRRDSGRVGEDNTQFDVLIPGFGGSSPSNNGEKEKDKERAWRRIVEESSVPEVENDLESFFSMDAPLNAAPSPMSTAEEPVFDTLFQNRGGSKVEQSSAGASFGTKKASYVTNIVDDFSFHFGIEGVPSSGEFQEIEGESKERRRARLNHYLRTQERMAKALDEKNQRDLQTQWEQEERHRLAETLDGDIKRWAAGKEGNLRSLLSSLQYVLWPECRWQPVRLTDLITSTSVKKVYYQATLCVHPDKVQQKGANLQQKYVAEKVFDLLKEAWNKFSSDEL